MLIVHTMSGFHTQTQQGHGEAQSETDSGTERQGCSLGLHPQKITGERRVPEAPHKLFDSSPSAHQKAGHKDDLISLNLGVVLCKMTMIKLTGTEQTHSNGCLWLPLTRQAKPGPGFIYGLQQKWPE